MRFFIHNGRYPVSTVDVAHSYIDAARRLGIPHAYYNWSSFCTVMNEHVGLQVSHSMAHRKGKTFNFTHLLNIANPDMPQWWLESTDHLKKIAITADSPWDWSEYEKRLKFWDLIFVNDKSISDYYKNKKIIYLPVAYGFDARQIIVDDPRYHSDICFIGTVYPSRVKHLEAVHEYCQKTGRKFILKGCLEKYVPEDSILWQIGNHEIVDHLDTIKYYSNTKIVINSHRDPHWRPTATSIYNKFKLDAYSLNPRFYEIAMCKSLQLMENNRPERTLFSDVCPVFNDDKQMIALIDHYLNNPELMQDYIERAYNLLKEHNYVNRLKIVLEKVGFKTPQLSEPILK